MSREITKNAIRQNLLLTEAVEMIQPEDLAICLRYGVWTVSEWKKRKIEVEADDLTTALDKFLTAAKEDE